MTDEQLANELRGIVHKAFPQSTNNKFAETDWVKRLIGLIELVPVHQYAAVRAALFAQGPYQDIEDMEPFPARLTKLALRLEADGQYVNAGIVFEAAEYLNLKL